MRPTHDWSLERPLHLKLTVPHEPAAIGIVRHAVCCTAEPAGHAAVEELGLIITELVTNAIIHTEMGPDASMDVELEMSSDHIRGRVVDRGRGFSLPDGPQPRVDGGFGLFIVERLSQRWGIDVTDVATTVWFEL